jgi:hypothetical protein
VAQGAGGLGAGRRTHPAAARTRRLRRVHARQHGRHPRVGAALLRRPAAGADRRRRRVPRAGPERRHRPARPARDRRRPGPQPRAHPAEQHPRRCLAAGPRPRSRRADSGDPAAAVHAPRRHGTGVGVPGQGPLRAGDAAQRPARLPRLSDLDGGRAPGRGVAALHPRRQAAGGDLLDRSPGRCRADVLRDHAAVGRAGVDARPAGDDDAARPAVHGRGVRLLPADRQPTVEAADADAAQAGARPRGRGGAGDAEPGRPRLQGVRQHRHMVRRAAADRPRQGPRARRPRRRDGRVEPDPARRARPHDLGPGQAGVPDAQRAPRRPPRRSRPAG